MDRKDWNRIGLVAAIFLVPGGFVLGATLAARRAGKAINDSNDAKAAEAPNAAAPAANITTPDAETPDDPT